MDKILLATFLIIVCITYYYYSIEICPNTFPKILFQTWKSKTDIPPNMRYWSSTWKSKHPAYKYILWDDADNRNFVKKEWPHLLEMYDSYDVEIKRADAIRYMFLYTYGGIYADMDFECLKPLDTLLDSYACYDIILGSIRSAGISWNVKNSIPNAIMISKPRNPFWLRVLDSMKLRAGDGKGRVEEQTGPIVLKEVYESCTGSQIKVLGPDVLYPISWMTDAGERKKSLENGDYVSLTKEMRVSYPSSYAVTYWTHSW